MTTVLLKEKGTRQLLAFLAAVVLVTNTLLMLAVNNLWSSYHTKQVAENIAIIGQVLQSHPNVEEALLGAFREPQVATFFESGLLTTEKYGYTPDARFAQPSLIKTYQARSAWLLSLISLLGLAAFAIAAFARLLNILRRLRQMSVGAESIMSGRFGVELPETGEGELSLLSTHFNLMSRRLQHSLAELSAEKENLKELIAEISHQLKTPLASLHLTYDLLLEGEPPPPETQHAFLQKGLKQVLRMEWMIQTLLELSRLESGVIRFHLQRKDVVGTVESAISSLTVLAQSKHQALHFASDDGEILLLHDTKWLEEAVRNVVQNAIEYTPENGRVKVAVSRRHTVVCIEVTDSGAGISPEELPFVFNRFYRGQASQQVKNSGSGIGLSLTKLVVEKHGGFVEVRSSPHQGSTFTLMLPELFKLATPLEPTSLTKV